MEEEHPREDGGDGDGHLLFGSRQPPGLGAQLGEGRPGEFSGRGHIQGAHRSHLDHLPGGGAHHVAGHLQAVRVHLKV